MLQTCTLLDELELLTRDGTVGLRVRAKPGARRSAILGVQDGSLVVALAAPPRDGLANEELIIFLARVANVQRRCVELVSGGTGRHKLVRIHGVDEASLRANLLKNP